MRKFCLIIVFALVCALVLPFAKASPPQGFTDERVVSGLTEPSDYAFAQDGRIFISQLNGDIKVFKNGQLLAQPALSLSKTSSGISLGEDRGLMSLTLDPNFASNNFVYLLYTTSENHERISRFTFNGDVVDPNSEKVLLENASVWGGFLNAGALRYNPFDGKLYATMGSNGEGGTAQDLASLNGKLLRINLDGSIPVDNPFVNVPGAQGSIWSSGFRNPWRMNVDKSNGTVIIGDVGENDWEKIVRSAKGANFGWPDFEGSCAPNCGSITPPMYVYSHPGSIQAAVIGGDMLLGSSFPQEYAQAYFYGDFMQGWIGALKLDSGGNVLSSSIFDDLGAIFDLGTINFGLDGCLYYAKYTSGELHKYCYNPGPQSTMKVSLDAAMNAKTYSGGSNAKIMATITANENASNLLLDIEIWGSSGKLNQHLVSPISLAANIPSFLVWSPTLPGVSGNYTVKVGLFEQDWSKQYAWNDNAASFTVTGSPPVNFTSKITLDNTTYNPSSAINLSSNLTASQNVTDALLNVEIHNSTGKVSQQFAPVSLIANQTLTSDFSFIGPQSNGAYTVKTGVFKNDWSELFFWDNNAAGFDVTSPSSGFAVSAILPSVSFPPNSTSSVITKVTSIQDLPNIVIDTEIADASNTLVSQKLVFTNLSANQLFTDIWDLTMPASLGGPYTVKLGIFSQDFKSQHFWQNRAAQFFIGPPPPSPEPGKIYPISLLNLQNNQSVSGEMEVKAVINGLEINSYSLAWRTGSSGNFQNLDTDPVSLAFKHAWINFNGWNWMPTYIYPLEFQAKDQAGNIIGNLKLNVIINP